MAPALPAEAPRRWSLATWVSVGTLLLVLVALAAMAVASAIAVDRLAHRQSLARAELAAGSARARFQQLGDAALAAARTLAAGPALGSQLREPVNALTLGITLRNACAATGASACAVRRGGALLASTAALPWDEVAAARAAQGERFALAPRAGGAPLLGGAAAAAAAPGDPAVEVWVSYALDETTLARAGGTANAQLRVQNISTYQAPPGDPLTTLHGSALGGTGIAVAPVPALGSDAASVVIANALGEPVALVDVLLPRSDSQRTAATYRRVLYAVAVLVALLSGLAALLAGRWFARPVVKLADMARRIGRGDFSPPVPEAVPSELRTLGLAMDEMRQNLVELTTRLRDREAEARSVVDGVAEGVFVCDAERRIVDVNARFLELLGQPAQAVLGRPCGDVLHPGVPESERPCSTRCPILAARAGQPARLAEGLPGAGGARRSALVTSAPAAGGRQVQLLRDESELEAARRARDGVLANISHEFRTPLASQLAAIELLRARLAGQGDDEQRQLLDNVERGGIRLLRLVDNLLESVRIESGHLGLRQQDTDLGAAATEAAALLAPLAAQAGLRIEIDAAALSALALRGDPPRLQQAYVNLLANALKFAPAGTTITVSGQREAGWIVSWVDDEGPGLPPGDPAALFQRFARGPGAEPAAAGLGLGLWIVRSIIERHGGTAWAERTTAGRTRFAFRLPASGSP